MHQHHIVARAEGGLDVSENIAILCEFCHKEWHTLFQEKMTFDEFLALPTYFELRFVFCQAGDVFRLVTGESLTKVLRELRQARRESNR